MRPTLANGGYVRAEVLNFPHIPGVAEMGRPADFANKDIGYDYGDGTKSGQPVRELKVFPPKRSGDDRPTYLSNVDPETGNTPKDIALVHPCVSKGLATCVGFNLRNHQSYPGEIAGEHGSFFYFPLTEYERQQTEDTRPAIKTLYRSKDAYLSQVESETRSLVNQGLLLERDIPWVMRGARALWTSAVQSYKDPRINDDYFDRKRACARMLLEKNRRLEGKPLRRNRRKRGMF